MKLVFASPTYGPVDPQAVVSQRNAIMHAAANGVTWLGDASPDRMGFAAARNAVVQSIVAQVDSDLPDAVFWCDSDVILPAHAITSLVVASRDFITGLYFQRKPPYVPLAYIFDPKGGTDRKGTFRQLTEWPPDTVGPIDGCGFGCVLTSIKLLKSLDPPWFEWKKFGEDFTFCLNARAAGFQLYVHTGVLCGHLADPVPVTVDTYLAHIKELPHGTIRPPVAARDLGIPEGGPGLGGPSLVSPDGVQLRGV
jgi:hypothetical protein